MLRLTDFSEPLEGRGTVLLSGDHKLERGRVHLVVGPNGCGKTSLLDAIALRVVRAWPESLSADNNPSIAYLPQHLSAADDVAVSGLLRLARIQGTDGNRQRYLEALSFGMRQRLLAECVLRQRRLLVLLDEPFRFLDAAAVDYIAALIRQALVQPAIVLLSDHLSMAQSLDFPIGETLTPQFVRTA